MRTSSHRSGAARRRLTAVLMLALLVPNSGQGQGQGPVTLNPPTTLFALDLSGTPVGEFPASLRLLNGIVAVALRDGVPMLKASAASEFVITLPQLLPSDFTLEFDLVPKLPANLPQDLSFEGSPTINQGVASAHVLWHAGGELVVIGGGGTTYDTPMPDELKATLPGRLTRVVAEFQGRTLKLYTNGRRLYTLDKQFARGRVVRVFLGGVDAGDGAVYLAGVRVTTGSGLGIIAAGAGLPSGGQRGQGTVSSPAADAPPNSSAISGLTAAAEAPWGVILRWDPIKSAWSYEVEYREGAGTFQAAPVHLANGVRANVLKLYPARHYEFRVKGLGQDGSLVGYSVPARFDPPLDWPKVNLAAEVGPLEKAALTFDGTTKPARKVTWTWDPLPSGWVQMRAEWYRIAVDPTTNQVTTEQWPQSPYMSPPFTMTMEAGTTVRACVGVSNPFTGQGLAGPACLDTPVPGDNAAIATATNQSGLTGTTGGAPSVTGVSVQLDAQGKATVSWQPVAGATSYFVARWLVGDPACCGNTSPPEGISSLSWQDAQLPKGGTYGYRVYATTAEVILTGETTVAYTPSAIIGTASNVPLPGAEPVSLAPMSAAGPAQTTAQFSVSGAVGVVVGWTPVPNATAYRIYRMPSATEAGVLRGTILAPSAARLGAGEALLALDPEPLPGSRYWVEAELSGGLRTEPGPIADVTNAAAGIPFGWTGVPTGVQASVGGTTTVTTREGATVRGNRVTWTWDAPGAGTTYAYVNFVSVEISQPGPNPLLVPLMHYRSEMIKPAAELLIPLVIPGGVVGPPYTLAFAAGTIVRFCVSYFPVTDQQIQANTNGCVTTALPP